MLAVALDRKGTPLTIVYADPNTTLKDPTKSTAVNSGGNVRGTRVGMTAQEAAHQAFSRIHNDSVVVLPGKKSQIFDVDMIPQNANQEAFIGALDFCNKSIMRALLIPSLVFGNGDGTGSYSLGQEHAKTFTKILDGMLEGVEDVLLEQLIKELLMYNWPQEMFDKDGFGHFEKSDFSDEDLEKVSRIWTTAIQDGVIDTNDMQDLNRMRTTLGFSDRKTPIEKPQPDMGLFGGKDAVDNEGNL